MKRIIFFIRTVCNVSILALFISCRAWISFANVQPFSDNLLNEIRQQNPKNIKLQKAIKEMAIYKQEMMKKLAMVTSEKNEASFQKRCLRSTHIGIQNCKAVQMPADIPDNESMQIRTRNTKTTKKNIEIATGLHFVSKPDEKKHFLRSTRTVSDLRLEQPPKEMAKRHHKLSFQLSIDPEDENPPKKRACKTKTTNKFGIESGTKEGMNSTIAARTRSQIALANKA